MDVCHFDAHFSKRNSSMLEPSEKFYAIFREYFKFELRLPLNKTLVDTLQNLPLLIYSLWHR